MEIGWTRGGRPWGSRNFGQESLGPSCGPAYKELCDQAGESCSVIILSVFSSISQIDHS